MPFGAASIRIPCNAGQWLGGAKMCSGVVPDLIISDVPYAFLDGYIACNKFKNR